jgi:hypothetical protein
LRVKVHQYEDWDKKRCQVQDALVSGANVWIKLQENFDADESYREENQ